MLLRWMPPEFHSSGSLCPESDVWSLGVLVWEVMTAGGVPYEVGECALLRTIDIHVGSNSKELWGVPKCLMR